LGVALWVMAMFLFFSVGGRWFLMGNDEQSKTSWFVWL
jgi:hypothetical protein